MLRSLGNALDSSVGRKALMALTGLLLVGFLVAHLVGNVTLYVDGDGAAFDKYAHTLKSYGGLLLVAEFLLAALFVAHIAMGIRLALRNREARKERYVVRTTHGRATAGSMSMLITGSLVLLFLIKHILDFRLDGDFDDGPAALVKASLSTPFTAFAYLLGVGALTLHLSHAVRSSLQTLGVNHPEWNPLLERAGIGLSILLGLGFASFPLYFLLLWDGGAA